MMSVAPELDGGLDALRRARGAGVLAALGHTDATYDVARAAVRAGAQVATALFRRAVRDSGSHLAEAVHLSSTTPARLLGLADRGRVAPGLRADLVLLDEDLRLMAT